MKIAETKFAILTPPPSLPSSLPYSLRIPARGLACFVYILEISSRNKAKDFYLQVLNGGIDTLFIYFLLSKILLFAKDFKEVEKENAVLQISYRLVNFCFYGIHIQTFLKSLINMIQDI